MRKRKREKRERERKRFSLIFQKIINPRSIFEKRIIRLEFTARVTWLSEGKESSNHRERRLIKSTDTGERNVDIIRNIRDALKVIGFHIRASTARALLQRQKRKKEKERESERERENERGNGAGTVKGWKGKGHQSSRRGRVEKDGAHLAAVRGLSLGLFFLFAVSSQVSTIH